MADPDPWRRMHVIATAGHVDHGKSALVRALTGMEPDRWAEERRRGMTIDLGFAWTTVPGGATVAFVDVPGHERFTTNMLAGVGPVPAVMLVVAADEGWMPQTAEHVMALHALGVRDGLVAVTRADLADPGPVLADVRRRLGPTGLRGAPAVAVSAVTGAGLGALRDELAALVARLPDSDPAAPVRLWIDRAFTVRGSGTVVTGTLGAGTLRVGQALELAGARETRSVRVRGLQVLGRPVEQISGVARIAVNLRGADRHDILRGDALLGPGAWRPCDSVDVLFEPSAAGGTAPRSPADDGTGLGSSPEASPGRSAGKAGRDGVPELPVSLVVHVGSAATAARPRLLGIDSGRAFYRLALHRPLPLGAGDITLVRDPGQRLVLGRATILAVDPAPLTRRGAAAARAGELRRLAAQEDGPPGRPDAAAMVRRHGLLTVHDLEATGARVPDGAVRAGPWVIDPETAAVWRDRMAAAVVEHRRRAPLDVGPTVEQLRSLLGLPDSVVVTALVQAPLGVRDGRVIDPGAAAPLPDTVVAAVRLLVEDLQRRPFSAPEAARLAELGLGPRELAAAERVGVLLRIAEGVVVLPDIDVRAARVLADLEQPFTLGRARQALGTTRRVAVPLLELLDRRRVTRRLPDDRRELRPSERDLEGYSGS